jgi:hypothetical protein
MLKKDGFVGIRVEESVKAEFEREAKELHNKSSMSDYLLCCVQLSRRIFNNHELMRGLYQLQDETMRPASAVLEAIVIKYFADLEAWNQADVEDKVLPSMLEFTVANGKALAGKDLFDFLVKAKKDEIEREAKKRKEWERRNDAQFGVTPDMLAAARRPGIPLKGLDEKYKLDKKKK